MPNKPRTKERYQNESARNQENQEEATPPSDKRGCLLSLAKKLQQLFPEQYEELAQVIERVQKENAGTNEQQTIVTVIESEQDLIESSPIPVPGKEKKGHIRDEIGGSTTSDLHDQEKEEIDPRGRAPEQKDPLIHIFVDHSNILCGLPQPKSVLPSRERSNTLPSRTRQMATVNRVDAPAAVTTSTHPLLVSSTGSDALQNKTQSLSRSFPTTSPLAARLRTTDLSQDVEHRISPNSDGHGGLGVKDTDAPKQKKKKLSRRLWYAAFVLVLERGRPATRRVVVASRKPMETMSIGIMEQFGYEVRILIRVPDTGDGLDHEQYKGKGNLSKVGHAQEMPRSTSLESSSGRNVSGAATASLNPNYGKINVQGTPPNKVKYREQGVDELLQLKLYQAITEPDDIPDGSTIVLATGDGGPGQFDEQGFLGPIQTALRLGWNVELYAWEDSLSRAWEREFGEKAKSGKRGVFRIIGMKQFAGWLGYDWA